MKHLREQEKSFYGEMLNFRKNGEKYWNYLRIAPVRDASGVVTHYVGIQTDVTLMRQRDFEIKEQREELLHVTRVGKLSEFVSSLAHEISQPLTAILSYAQAAQRILAGPPTEQAERELQLQEILQYIVNDDQRASEVIRRLRSLLKKSDPEFELLDTGIFDEDRFFDVFVEYAKADHEDILIPTGHIRNPVDNRISHWVKRQSSLKAFLLKSSVTM